MPGGGGAPSPILWFFSKIPPSKPMPAHEVTFHLKMKPIWKTTPSPPRWNVKHPSTKWFLEKPQSIVTWNLAKILEKYVWRSSFLVNFQACRPIAGNFTIKWTPSQVFLESILTPPMLLPCIVLSPHKK